MPSSSRVERAACWAASVLSDNLYALTGRGAQVRPGIPEFPVEGTRVRTWHSQQRGRATAVRAVSVYLGVIRAMQ